MCGWLRLAEGGGNLIKLYDELDTLILAVEGSQRSWSNFKILLKSKHKPEEKKKKVLSNTQINYLELEFLSKGNFL